ncbi:MAG: sugar phosphate isomerase/epimerase family protein [Bacillota bacterium]
MTKLGIQISSVRKYLQTPEDVLESFRKMSIIGYKAIQIQWISPDVSMGFINDALKETKLNCIGTQDYYDRVIPNLDEIIKMNNLWGGTYICVSGIPERFQSFQGCMSLAAELNKITKRLEKEGKILCFHPRSQEFERYDGQIALDILLENTVDTFQVCLDVFHVQKAGYDPINWLKKLNGRVDLVHFKDMAANPSDKQDLTPIGQGTLNWEDIFKTCKQTGVKYGFAEQERWEKDPFKCFEESYKFITKYGIK